VRGTQLVYLEDMSAPRATATSSTATSPTRTQPARAAAGPAHARALVEAIKVLPEREQYVMSMYYEHDMNLKEIAAVLKVTESRVCQLHSQSIARLRVKLRDF
jgi:RNA polymerase sigma factor for flagellar operon FliA